MKLYTDDIVYLNQEDLELMKTLYADCDTETYKRICNVADSKDLTDKQKLLIMTEEFR